MFRGWTGDGANGQTVTAQASLQRVLNIWFVHHSALQLGSTWHVFGRQHDCWWLLEPRVRPSLHIHGKPGMRGKNSRDCEHMPDFWRADALVVHVCAEGVESRRFFYPR